MTLSYKSIFGAFTLVISLSAALLSYQLFFPKQIKTELNHRQYQQDLLMFLEATKQHSAFAAIEPQRLITITETASRLMLEASGFNHSTLLQQQLQQLLSQLNDPAAIALAHNSTSLEMLPFEPIFDGQNWQAFTPQGRLMEPDFPYLSHIDGIPISRWVQASQHYLTNALKHSSVAQATWIKQIGQLRAEIGLRASNESVITLSDGETSVQRSLSLVQHNKLQTKVPVKQDKASTSQAQIFRLPSQVDAETLLSLTHQLTSQQADDHIGSPSSALIIDIREIKQPQQQLTAWLSKHFSHAVGNDGDGYVDNKFKHQAIAVLQYKRFATARADRIASQYPPMEQLSFFEQIELNNRGFDNDLIQDSPFSDYLIRKRPTFDEAPTTVAGLQVFLRIDASCEQECEWLALASKQWPQVSLIGETSRGSLSPLHRFTLPNSGIKIQFSSALVYETNGQLLSGVGIDPELQLQQQAFRKHNIDELITEKWLAKTSTANINRAP
ncbi:hypothetical protein [Shewanella pealeana]|uniref:Tail specific protease domain-containing protein n=1 Tax=Shewanella pealeana (strain ATCC 700345 / ANG-SQ1) TaxID=398579 RepID=A8H0A0_SHEPA|nr:hypothetical protein [Shewanella pealeana]ABV85987.1 hypothetical protein Spea_0660 [Shewanella pealeana ATCC 700345]